MGVAENFRALMEQKGITEDELSKVTKAKPEEVRGWLAGKTPKTKHLVAIIDRYGVTREELLGDESGLGADLLEPRVDGITAYRQALGDVSTGRIESLLAPKDGKLHVLMLNTFGSLSTSRASAPDEKYTVVADHVLGYIQDQGREIVDIRFNDDYGVGLSGGISYHTLVVYR